MRSTTLGFAVAATFVFALAYVEMRSEAPVRLVARTSRTKRTGVSNVAEEAPNLSVYDYPSSERVENRSVAKIVDGRISVESVDAWVEFSGPAITDALRRGMRGPEEVMAYVMRMALPRHPWPPQAASLQQQWKLMVADVAELLHFEPEPESDTRLRIVK